MTKDTAKNEAPKPWADEDVSGVHKVTPDSKAQGAPQPSFDKTGVMTLEGYMRSIGALTNDTVSLTRNEPGFPSGAILDYATEFPKDAKRIDVSRQNIEGEAPQLPEISNFPPPNFSPDKAPKLALPADLDEIARREK